MTELRLITFGGVRVFINGQDSTADLPIKIVALLVYLARHNQPKSREHLAELLWPDRSAKQAYGSLRTAISKSKPILGDILHVGHQEISLNSAWLDANLFESLLNNPATVGEALALYTGEFMASFFTGDAREFEGWQLRETEKLHELYIQTTIHHIQVLQDNSRAKEAIILARQALALSPLQEELQRALIALYHANGDRVSALRQYHAYRSLLWEELGLEPDTSIQTLYQQLEHSPVTTIATDYPLPPRITSFVGRTDAIHQVEKLVRDNTLVTITATGGAGKTRLALEVAYRLRDSYRDGVCFVDLSEITHPDHVLPAIANALGLPDDVNPRTQLAIYLKNREMLLICDNFEHVLNASDILAEWMRLTPHLTMLVTSREPLKLYGECLFHLQAFSLQESCQLFYERLRAIHNDFYRTESVDNQIKAICQRLDGLPLAIELAVTRARTMSFDEIYAGLSQCLGLLTSDLRNMPRRQRTLFATIDWSYSLLTPKQARLFSWLSVFRGGWTHEATRTISPDANELVTLVDKNLIRRLFIGTSRFTMLETMREYAQYQLEKSGELADAQNAHARWMLQFAETCMNQLRTSAHTTVVAAMKEEEENIRVALDYLATQPDQLETYARIISALSWAWNFLQIANLPFHHAKNAIARADKLPESLRAPLLVGGGHSANALGHYELAESWQQEGLRLFEKMGDTVNVNYTRFFISGRMIDTKESLTLLFELRKIAIQDQDDYFLSLVDLNLGVTLLHSGQKVQSKAMLEEGLGVCERYGYWVLIAMYYLNLANANYANGDIQKAFNLLEQAYTISQNDGNQYNEAFSLLELCELCYVIGRIDDLNAYLRESERIVKDLNLPTLYVRFYFWHGFLASLQGDVALFYSSYTQVLRNLHIDNANASSYLINTLLYLAYFMTKRGDLLKECAVLIGGTDAYIHTSHISYSSFQQAWYKHTKEALDNQFLAEEAQGNLLDIKTVLDRAQDLLDKFLQ
ncbi:MAG: BTAD domain-containing putative transcriptional regulator [bacterium]|nr:BTAD domain-containing putative transcriptional regulator [bacterium]